MICLYKTAVQYATADGCMNNLIDEIEVAYFKSSFLDVAGTEEGK